MGRSVITPFPGPNQAGLGILPDLRVPTVLATSLYAGYVLNSQFGHNPTEDVSQNGRDADNIGVDFSRGDFPGLGSKNFLRMPFAAVDLLAGGEMSILLVVKMATGTGLYTTFMGGFDILGPGLNNVPDTHTPILYVDNADRLVAQQQVGGFLSAPTTPADAGASNFHVIGMSLKRGSGTGSYLGAIRAYRKRAGQAAQYTQTVVDDVLANPGTNPLWIGMNNFGGSGPATRQVAAAFFFNAAKDQAAFNAAYASIATLLNPFLAASGGL